MPRVSVLIPTYNSAHFLDDAIKSVLNQTFTDYEVIIVDNCSTDDSTKVVSKYLLDSRVKYYVNESNIGLVGNFNKCFSLASGDYIKCLCSDDKLHPLILEKFVSIMEQHQDVKLVSSYYEEFGLSATTVETKMTGLVEGKEVIKNVLASKNFLGNPSQVMFRKESLKVGVFREASPWNADLEFFFRILTTGKCFIVPEVLSYTRIHHGAASQAMIRNFSTYFGNYDLAKALEMNESHLDFSGIDIKTLVKAKAKDCILVFPHTLHLLQKKQHREAFKKALAIVYREKVFFSFFSIVSKRIFTKLHLPRSA